MKFIREIQYEVWLRNGGDTEEIMGQFTVYTALEIPQAFEALEKRHVVGHIKILQYRTVPFLEETQI